MFCTVCNHDLKDCECPDIDARLADLAKNPTIAIAIKQNQLERELRKKKIKPENN